MLKVKELLNSDHESFPNALGGESGTDGLASK